MVWANSFEDGILEGDSNFITIISHLLLSRQYGCRRGGRWPGALSINIATRGREKEKESGHDDEVNEREIGSNGTLSGFLDSTTVSAGLLAH